MNNENNLNNNEIPTNNESNLNNNEIPTNNESNLNNNEIPTTNENNFSNKDISTNNDNNTIETGSKKNNKVWILIVIILLIVIGVLCYFLFFNKDNKIEQNDNPKEINQEEKSNKEEQNDNYFSYSINEDNDFINFEQNLYKKTGKPNSSEESSYSKTLDFVIGGNKITIDLTEFIKSYFNESGINEGCGDGCYSTSVSVNNNIILEENIFKNVFQIDDHLFALEFVYGGGTGRSSIIFFDSDGNQIKKIIYDMPGGGEIEGFDIIRDEDNNVINFVYYYNGSCDSNVEKHILEYDYNTFQFGKDNMSLTEYEIDGVCY